LRPRRSDGRRWAGLAMLSVIRSPHLQGAQSEHHDRKPPRHCELQYANHVEISFSVRLARAAHVIEGAHVLARLERVLVIRVALQGWMRGESLRAKAGHRLVELFVVGGLDRCEGSFSRPYPPL